MRDRNEAHAISAPTDLEGKPASLDLNVDGLGEHSSLRCAVLDERHQPLPGFALDDCMAPAASGFRQRVHWRGGEKIASAGRIRVRVQFTGIRPEDIALYALYPKQA